MQITFLTNPRNGKRELVQIDDARITYKNFVGAGDKFNREGDRNFALIIPNEGIADELSNDKNEYGAGWNVKVKPPREEGDDPFITLKVKVKFNNRGPNVYLRSGKNKVRLTEETIGCLDDMYIDHVNLDIRPYDDEINGRPFRTAYLQSMEVYQNVAMDRFAAEEYPEE